MNRFFTLLLAASCLTAVGQVTYPYNPDGNTDGDIAVGDLQDFLVTYGNPFSPSEIMVGDSSLTYWVEQLSQTLLNQESLISTLQLSSTNDLAFPIGYSGESINQRVKQDVPFVVPQSQVFHLTSWRGYTPLINGLRCQTPQTMPIILNSGDSLRTDDNNWSHFSGILMDAQGLVVGVNRAIDCNNPFVVPQGKNLYMTHWLSNGAEPASGELQIPIPYGIPVILNSGDTLTNGTSPQCFSSTLNGYLVDEDFFDTPLQDPSDEQSDWGCGDPVSYEGHDYQTVKAGGRCWFAETLKYLPSVNNWNDASFDEPRYYVRDYNGNSIDEAYAQSGFDSVGVYYNRAALLSDICPVGWSVPVVHDWIRLLPVSDGNQNPWPEGGSYLIQPSDWPDPNIEIPPHRYNLWDGFHIQPNGRLFPSSEGYEWDGVGNHFWQNALVNTLIGISFSDLNVDFLINSLGFATTVRCIKDAE